MQPLSCTSVLTAAGIIALVCFCAEAAPIMNNTAAAENGSTPGNYSHDSEDLPQFDFQYNCSSEEVFSKNETNSTYLDFAIGLFVLKDYLKGVVSNFNITITMDDDESFVPCYPAPVNTMRLVQLKALGSTATRVSNVAAWYGVLAAYAKYTAGLLENESDLPPHVVKKLTTVFEMLQSVLQLFADVVGPFSCTDEFEIDIEDYDYNDNTECSKSFDTLKFAANMITHLQAAVSDIRDVQKDWYAASSIRRYLQASLAKDLKSTWISRYTTSC